MGGIIAFIEAWINGWVNSGIEFLSYSLPAILVYGLWRAGKHLRDDGVFGWAILNLVVFLGFGLFGSIFFVAEQYGSTVAMLNFAFWIVVSMFIAFKKLAPRRDKTEED